MKRMPRKRKPEPAPDADLLAALDRLTPAQIIALHRVAKDPGRGVRPFFRHPRAMIALRSRAASALSG